MEGRRGAWDVNPGRSRRSSGEEVGGGSEGRGHGAAHVGYGGVSGGLDLRPLDLLPFLLVSVLVAAEGLGVGELAVAVVALVLSAVGRRRRFGGGVELLLLLLLLILMGSGSSSHVETEEL